MSTPAFEGGTEFTSNFPELEFAPAGDTGYDVKATILRDPQRREWALERRNAELHDGGSYVKFFCQEVELSVTLAGKTAQSTYVRDFYPHNIQIPSFEVAGQCLDQRDYATVIEFIHRSQRKAAQAGGLVQLRINKGGSNIEPPAFHGKPSPSKVRGAHAPILAKGYIKAVPREYKQFENQPNFKFEFVVAEMIAGIYGKEILFETPTAATWLQILEGLTKESQQPASDESPKPLSEAEQEGLKSLLIGANADAETILETLKGL